MKHTKNKEMKKIVCKEADTVVYEAAYDKIHRMGFATDAGSCYGQSTKMLSKYSMEQSGSNHHCKYMK